MKIRLSLLLLSTSLPVFAATPFPADVEKFVEQRDGCDHFRGEEPYDEERRQFLLKNLTALCSGTDKKLAQLKKKYKKSPEVVNKLNGYEAKIETGSKNP